MPKQIDLPAHRPVGQRREPDEPKLPVATMIGIAVAAIVTFLLAAILIGALAWFALEIWQAVLSNM